MKSIAILSLALAACSSAAKPGPAEAAKATYLGEHLKCVEQFKTDEEINACRETVRQRWNKPRDAGSDQ